MDFFVVFLKKAICLVFAFLFSFFYTVFTEKM